MKSYALWDIRTANIIQAYDNERDALALVLSGIERNGPQDTDTLILNVEDENGNVSFIAQGKELAEMAHRELSTRRKVG